MNRLAITGETADPYEQRWVMRSASCCRWWERS
jgi:hypothetical protein